MLTGIGIETFVATSRSATLSGGFTSIEAMPKWIQRFSLLNPIAHFATLSRGGAHGQLTLPPWIQPLQKRDPEFVDSYVAQRERILRDAPFPRSTRSS